MPIYEYQCRSCGHHFEALVRDATIPVCPSCGGRDHERLLSVCAMSSAQTRAMNRTAAHKQTAKARRDYAHAEHERFHKHEH